jgi:lipooligosaccharide transport system ATP-binding protein
VAKTIVEARSLVKYFGSKLIIDGVHMDIAEEECFAVLGAQNAGKSTLLSLLACVNSASAGDLFIEGLNAKVVGPDIRRKIGVCFEKDIFNSQLNVEENLWSYAKFMGMTAKEIKDRITEVLRFLEIADFSNSSTESLNNFEKRCLSLGRALVHQPSLIVVDELLTGLSLLEQNFLVDRLRDLKKEGKTIIFSTDSYTEASVLADRVGILAKGKLQLEGKPKNLVEEEIGFEVVEFLCRDEEIEYLLSKLTDKYEYRVRGNRVYVYIRKGQDSRNLIDMISSDELSLRKAKLSDVVTKLELTH